MSTKKTVRSQRECDQFNANVQVGDAVDVLEDDGRLTRAKTRSDAQLMGGCTPVIWLVGRSGCFLLSRVTAPLGAKESA